MKRSAIFGGLITARKGSRRLPQKNVMLLQGKPLIEHTIGAALGTPELTFTAISTDSAEVLELATRLGCVANGLRPDELATDSASSVDVIRYELEQFTSSGRHVDFIVLLQPTSPLRTADDIQNAIALFDRVGADTLTSLTPAKSLSKELWKQHGEWFSPIEPPRVQSELENETLFHENGAIYIVSANVIRAGNFYGHRTAGYIMTEERSVDIDTIEDFERIKKILKV